MIDQILKIITNSFPAIISFFIVNSFTGNKVKFWTKKTLIAVSILTIATCLLYYHEYNIFISLAMYVCLVIIYKFLFNFDYSKSVIVNGIMILLMLAVEFILSIVLMPFVQTEAYRNDAVQNLIINIISAAGTICLSQFPPLKREIISLIERLDELKGYKIIVFVISVFVVLCLFIYIIFHNYRIGFEYIITLVSSIIFLLLLILYINEQLEYNRLNKEFDFFIDYVTTLEEWIDNAQLNKHEYKNDLAILRTKIKEPAALKFIDEKLNSKLEIDEQWMNELKNIPKGGLKGLIYYKIILAKNKKLNFSINVSKMATNKLSKIKGIEFKDLCHLLGIYLDNALYAAEESSKRALSLEIYVLNDQLNIVISNSYKGKIDLVNMNKRGYTTKGKDHGNGLYFTKKIIDKNPYIVGKQSLTNKFYVQRLIISNTQTKKQA